jgi:6-phosphogluconolactonase
MAGLTLTALKDAETLASTAAQAWLDYILAAQAQNRPLHVALSGGRIARSFLEATARAALDQNVSFDHLHFFWADERCVPPDDEDSNFRLAQDHLFSPLKIPEAGIHRIRGEDRPARAAEQAANELRRVVVWKGEQDTPVLDLVFLGMGEDGHVASLFPNGPLPEQEQAELFYAVTASKPPPQRITMSYQLLKAARDVVVLVSGPGKEAALKSSIAPDGKTPLGKVIQSRVTSLTRILTDIPL